MEGSRQPVRDEAQAQAFNGGRPDVDTGRDLLVGAAFISEQQHTSTCKGSCRRMACPNKRAQVGALGGPITRQHTFCA